MVNECGCGTSQGMDEASDIVKNGWVAAVVSSGRIAIGNDVERWGFQLVEKGGVWQCWWLCGDWVVVALVWWWLRLGVRCRRCGGSVNYLDGLNANNFKKKVTYIFLSNSCIYFMFVYYSNNLRPRDGGQCLVLDCDRFKIIVVKLSVYE